MASANAPALSKLPRSERRLAEVTLILGFISEPALKDAIASESAAASPRTLDLVLRGLGLVSEAHVSIVKGLLSHKGTHEDLLLARLLDQEKIPSAGKVLTTLREEWVIPNASSRRRLLRACVDKAVFDLQQAHHAARSFRENYFVCGACFRTCNIAGRDPVERFKCEECGSAFQVPPLPDMLRDWGLPFHGTPATGTPESSDRAEPTFPTRGRRGKFVAGIALAGILIVSLVGFAFHREHRKRAAIEAIGAADRMFENGDFEASIAAYGSLMASHGSPRIHGEELEPRLDKSRRAKEAVDQTLAEVQACVEGSRLRRAKILLESLEVSYPGARGQPRVKATHGKLEEALGTVRAEGLRGIADARRKILELDLEGVAPILDRLAQISPEVELVDEVDRLAREHQAVIQANQSIGLGLALYNSGDIRQALAALEGLDAPPPLRDRHAAALAKTREVYSAKARDLELGRSHEARGEYVAALEAYARAADVFEEAGIAGQSLNARLASLARRVRDESIAFAGHGDFAAADTCMSDAAAVLQGTPAAEILSTANESIRAARQKYETAAGTKLTEARDMAARNDLEGAKKALDVLLKTCPLASVRPDAESLLFRVRLALDAQSRLLAAEDALSHDLIAEASTLIAELRDLNSDLLETRITALERNLAMRRDSLASMSDGLAALDRGDWTSAAAFLSASLESVERSDAVAGLAWARFQLAAGECRAALSASGQEAATRALDDMRTLREDCGTRDTSAIHELAEGLERLAARLARDEALSSVNAALGREDAAGAEAACDQWLSDHGPDPDFLVSRARARRRSLNAAGAKQDLDSAIALDAGHMNARRQRADLLLELGDAAAAEADLSEVLRVEPLDALAWNDRGFARFLQGHFAQAEEDLLRATDLAPGLAAAWANLAATRERDGRPGPALEAAGRALALDPDHLGALQNRGLALYALERYAEAATDFARTTVLAPDNVSAWVNLGHSAFAAGDRPRAAAAWQRAMELDDGLTETLSPWVERALRVAEDDS